MKTCIVTTIKTKNKRLPGKTFRKINGKPLYTYTFSTLKDLLDANEIDEVCIYSSDEQVLNIAREWGFMPLKQPSEYDTNPSIAGNFLAEKIIPHLENYEIIGWVHITTPFLKKETIKKSISIMREKPEVDSIFGVIPRKNRFWYQNKPVNHDPNNLVRTQNLTPVQEEADFYFFRKDSFKKYRKRVCGNFEAIEVEDIEGVDIDTLADLLYAESLLKARENIVIVGTGDYYYRFLAPCLRFMEDSNVINVLATVDLKNKPFPKKDLFNEKEHRIRQPFQKLSDLISDLKEENPIIILGHANNFHVQDARDLISNGFRVMVEKPYAISEKELRELRELIREYPNKIVLLEYHLMRKVAPLLVLAELIDKDSFYFTTEEVLRRKDFLEKSMNSKRDIHSLIGDPLSIDIKILEGGNDIGVLNHRGTHLFDTRLGGGIIHDMGIHAVIPLFILREYIGTIDTSFKEGEIKTKKAEEYLELAIRLHDLPRENIAESHAEFNFLTSKNIPVNVVVGKYAPVENQRRFILKGTKGSLYLDYHTNILYLSDNKGEKKEILELTNPKDTRYLPVIKTALELINEKNPYRLNPTHLLLEVQEFILNIVKKARNNPSINV